MAQVDYFLKVKGIDGESADGKHKGEIDVESWSWGETQSGTGHFGGVDDGDHGVHHWARRGIVGRGVLADIARWREQQGRPLRHGQRDSVSAEELLECLAAQDTEVREGDILLVRFGWIDWYETQPAAVRESRTRGDAESLAAARRSDPCPSCRS